MEFHRTSRKLKRILPQNRREWAMFTFGASIILTGVAIAMLIHDTKTPLAPESKNITSSWVPATVKRWSMPINEMAKKYDIDPNLIAIIMTMESGGFSKAHSSADAKGLMQITPLTAQDIASKYLQKPVSTYDIWDPKTNIEFGAAYLAYLRDEFGENNQAPSWNATVELIAAGYNGGPGAAGRLYHGKGLTDTETVIYSRDAYNMWRERHAAISPTYERWLERGGSTLIEQAKAEQQ